MGSGAPGWALHRTPGWVLVRLSTVSLSRVWVPQKWFHSLVEVEGPVVDTRAGCLRMSRVMDLYRHEDWLSSMAWVLGLSQTRGLVVLDVSDSVEFHSQVTQCMP